MHPDDAVALGVADGDTVRVTSRIGSLEIPVKVTAPNEILPGSLQITHGWKDANVNLITHDDRFDPISGFPLMKSVEVRVERAVTGLARGPGRAPEMAASVDGVLCDAREATVPLYDDGLLRGDGAFEYLRCYAGRPFTLAEHLDRLARTCATLRLPYQRELLESEIAALLAWAGPVFTDLRIVLTRGGRRIVFLEPYLDWPPARLAFVTDSPRLVLAGAKSLSYAGNMVAKRTAEERGFGEALLTTPDGRVMEVQQAAFFWVTPQGDLCTPPLGDGILDSITRRIVMRHLEVAERDLPHRGRARRRGGVSRRSGARGPGGGGRRGPRLRRSPGPRHPARGCRLPARSGAGAGSERRGPVVRPLSGAAARTVTRAVWSPIPRRTAPGGRGPRR